MPVIIYYEEKNCVGHQYLSNFFMFSNEFDIYVKAHSTLQIH